GPQTGEATYYEVGLGACGITNTASDSIAAVSTALFDSFPGYDGSNPANNPICGKSATATYNGKSITFQIEDKCVGCAFGDLDFSTSAFIALFGSLDAGRVSGVTWSLD
ncbi:Non-catalytic module family EXPN protein, partial [Auricularia subglabra TFB-10046 SS5]